MTYECSICLNVNHVVKTQCSTCGTVPAMYSMLAAPMRYRYQEYFTGAIPVVIARGADRAEHHRTVRVYFGTVKADYYAS